MAMSMQELFYGEREPVTFVHYARQSSIPYSYDHQPFPELHGSRRPMANTFDLMVPMCSTRCVDQVREALLHLRGVHDVAFDPYEQRVTVTGYVDPVKALKQVKRVKRGAAFWSERSHTSHRYQITPVQESYGAQYDSRDYRSYPSQYNRSNGATYFRNFCGGYQDATTTHYVSFEPNIATRVELEY